MEQKIAQEEAALLELQKLNEVEQTKLANALSQFGADTASAFSELRQSYETAEVRWEEAASEKVTAIDAYARLGIEELDKKRTEAAQIVQAVGDILTTGTYKATAETEAKLANRYRNVTIALFIIGILIVISNYVIHAIALSEGIAYEESPWMIVSRFATALAVALPAIYTARESARHRTTADRARQRELELTTLGPFIELLPSVKKDEIRDRLTDRYFGGETDKHEVLSPIDADSLVKLFEAIAKARG